MMQHSFKSNSFNPTGRTKAAWIVVLGSLLCLLGVGCKTAAPGDDIPLELVSIDDAALKVPEVDSKRLAEEPLKHMKAAVTLVDNCLKLHGEEGVSKEDQKAYQSECFTALDTLLEQSWPFVGATFQLDRFYADASRAHDALRLALWRSSHTKSSESLMKESWEQAKTALARSKERAMEIIEEGEIETAIETRFVGDEAQTQERFLTSSEAELGLLFDQATRSIFKQGSNPNNVRAKIMKYHLYASKRRLLARSVYMLDTIKAGTLAAELEPLWRNYAARGLNLIRAIEGSLNEQLGGTDKSLNTAKKNKARVAEQYLKWERAHTALKDL